MVKRKSQIAKHRGHVVENGSFAVPKNIDEDRWISALCPTNSLVSPAAIPRPRFAYIPRLRSVHCPRHLELRVTKRDARHYFHMMKIGRRWHRWLAHPALPDVGHGVHYPVHLAIPMGIAMSAGWAQAITDVTTTRAGLPSQQQLVLGEPAPKGFPI